MFRGPSLYSLAIADVLSRLLSEAPLFKGGNPLVLGDGRCRIGLPFGGTIPRFDCDVEKQHRQTALSLFFSGSFQELPYPGGATQDSSVTAMLMMMS